MKVPFLSGEGGLAAVLANDPQGSPLVYGILEVEIVDVIGVEYGWRAKQDRTIVCDGVAAELACLEGITRLALDVTLHDVIDGVYSQVAEIAGIPQCELRSRAALDVF